MFGWFKKKKEEEPAPAPVPDEVKDPNAAKFVRSVKDDEKTTRDSDDESSVSITEIKTYDIVRKKERYYLMESYVRRQYNYDMYASPMNTESADGHILIYEIDAALKDAELDELLSHIDGKKHITVYLSSGDYPSMRFLEEHLEKALKKRNSK